MLPAWDVPVKVLEKTPTCTFEKIILNMADKAIIVWTVLSQDLKVNSPD